MSQIAVKVTSQMGPLKHLRGSMVAGTGGTTAATSGGNPAPYDAMKNLWGKRYESFARRRFDRQSKGGGEWPPLTMSTIRARRGPLQGSRAGVNARAVRSGFRTKGTRAASVGRTVTGRRVVSGRIVTILRDTGILFGALSIGGRGNLFGKTKAGIVFGFLPVPHGGPGATIAQIAGWHDIGAGHNPRRRILVQPDAQTRQQMTGDLARANQQAIRNAATAGRGK